MLDSGVVNYSALHLGDRPHPVVASAARELSNKSENERSGVLSTAMSFLGLYRDPIIAKVTSRRDWRIADLVETDRPTTLYLVVPPSDIGRTRPLIRLILNQIGRRLTEDLFAKSSRHRLLLMLDEFPALGRLDFFETALAFMAGYGLKSFLIAQSLNQIEKAYGQNNSILDNCHVRVAFAANDERTAKRLSDSLGIATELRAMKNYAGHRLSPWLGHLMVSRQETARPLLTAGEVMQLPPSDELVLVSGTPPIRARKVRYFKDRRLARRVLPPPTLASLHEAAGNSSLTPPTDWTTLHPPRDARSMGNIAKQADIANSGIRREPELPEHEAITREEPLPLPEFALLDDQRDRKAVRTAGLQRSFTAAACQAAMDPDDGMALWGSAMRTRMNVYFPPELLRQLIDLADRKRLLLSSIVEAAVTSFLSPDGADRTEAAFTRRLDRMSRQIQRLERNLSIATETLALFMRFWLTVTPQLPADAQATAQAKGRERFEAFVEALGRRLAQGRMLLHDIPGDIDPSRARRDDGVDVSAAQSDDGA